MENCLPMSTKFKCKSLCDPESIPTEVKAHVYQKICARVLKVAVFIITKSLSIVEWINVFTLWNICISEKDQL